MNDGIQPQSSRYAPMPPRQRGGSLPIPMPFAMRRVVFDPRRIPGLAAWYDAADSTSVTLDAGRVSQWSDKSGLGRHATNTTSGSTQPSYTAAGHNGLNVLSFAAASVQRLSVPSSTAAFKFLHDGTPCWWIAVSKFGTVVNPGAAYTLFATAAASIQLGAACIYDDTSFGVNNAASIAAFRGVSGFQQSATYNATTTQVLPAYQNVWPANTTLLTDCLFDLGNAVASERIALSVNGGAAVRANVRTPAPATGNATNNLTIGAHLFLGSFGNPLQGDICELMFFSQQPTAAARDSIRRYLGSKWGVAVT